jgi:hypothetical protein
VHGVSKACQKTRDLYESLGTGFILRHHFHYVDNPQLRCQIPWSKMYAHLVPILGYEDQVFEKADFYSSSFVMESELQLLFHSLAKLQQQRRTLLAMGPSL